MATIAELTARRDALKAELALAEQELHEALIAESPIKIGQIFTRTTTRGFGSKKKTIVQRAQVEKFARYFGRAAPMLRFIKKDGTPGERTVAWSQYDNWKLESDGTPIAGGWR